MSIGKMTVAKFCDEHNACADGKAWAIKTGAANMAALWVLADMRIEWRLWIFERSDVDKKTAVRFAVFCARAAVSVAALAAQNEWLINNVEL